MNATRNRYKRFRIRAILLFACFTVVFVSGALSWRSVLSETGNISAFVSQKHPVTLISMIDRNIYVPAQNGWDVYDHTERWIVTYDSAADSVTEYRSPFSRGYFITGDTENGALLINDEDGRFDLHYWKDGTVSEVIDSIQKNGMDYVFAYQNGWFFGCNENHIFRANSEENIPLMDGIFDVYLEKFRPAVSSGGSVAFFYGGKWSDEKDEMEYVSLQVIRPDGTASEISMRFDMDDESLPDGHTPAIIWLNDEQLLVFYEYRKHPAHQKIMCVDIEDNSIRPLTDAKGIPFEIEIDNVYTMGFGNASSDGVMIGMRTAVNDFEMMSDGIGLLDLENGEITVVCEIIEDDLPVYESAVVMLESEESS